MNGKTDTLGSKLNLLADYVGEREHDLYEYEINTP